MAIFDKFSQNFQIFGGDQILFFFGFFWCSKIKPRRGKFSPVLSFLSRIHLSPPLLAAFILFFCAPVEQWLMRQRFSLINCYARDQTPRVHTSQVSSVASFEPDHGGCTSVWPRWGETTGGHGASEGRCPGCRELTLESAPPIEKNINKNPTDISVFQGPHVIRPVPTHQSCTAKGL